MHHVCLQKYFVSKEYTKGYGVKLFNIQFYGLYGSDFTTSIYKLIYMYMDVMA